MDIVPTRVFNTTIRSNIYHPGTSNRPPQLRTPANTSARPVLRRPSQQRHPRLPRQRGQGRLDRNVSQGHGKEEIGEFDTTCIGRDFHSLSQPSSQPSLYIHLLHLSDANRLNGQSVTFHGWDWIVKRSLSNGSLYNDIEFSSVIHGARDFSACYAQIALFLSSLSSLCFLS